MNKIVQVILFIILLGSCNSKETNINIIDESTKRITIDTCSVFVPIDNLIHSLEIVPLETNKNCLISKIGQVLVIDSKFVIVSKGVKDKLLVFNSEGKFLHSIGSFGKGPGEFLEITHAGYNKYDDQIYIYDLHRRRVNFYSKEGKYLTSIKSKVLFRRMEYLKKDLIVLFANSGYNPSIEEHQKCQILLADENLEPFSFHFPKVTGRDFNIVSNSSLTNYNDEVFFNPQLTDNIYKIYHDSIAGFSSINLKLNPLPKSRINPEITNEEYRELQDRHNYFDGHFVNLLNYELYKFRTVSKEPGYVLYDKRSAKTYLFDNRDYRLIGSRLFRTPYNCYNNKLVCPLEAFVFVEASEQLGGVRSDRFKIIGQGLDLVKEDNNPILMIYGIKESIID